MLKELIGALRHFSQLRQNDVKKGLYTSEFAASLVRSYAESMMKALRIIGEDACIATIQAEADRQCRAVCPTYQPAEEKPTFKRKTKSKSRASVKSPRLHLAVHQPGLNPV